MSAWINIFVICGPFALHPLKVAHVEAWSQCWWASLRNADLRISHAKGWVHAPRSISHLLGMKQLPFCPDNSKKKKNWLKTKGLLDDVGNSRASLRLALPTTMWKEALRELSTLFSTLCLMQRQCWAEANEEDLLELWFGFLFLAALTDDSQIWLMSQRVVADDFKKQKCN